MPKHTRAPWTWDGDSLWHFGEGYQSENDPHRYTGITKDTELLGSQTLEANARLIAAAPDMLEALKGIAEFAEQEITDAAANIQEGGSFDRETANKWNAVLYAIAKARGESGVEEQGIM